MERRDPAEEALLARHLKAPSKARSLLLALGALALASPAYLYAALQRPAVVVVLEDALPEPSRVVVKVGQAVVWRNESSDVRTLEVEEGDERREAVLAPGESYEHRFHTAGVHRFGAVDVEYLRQSDGVIAVEP